MLYTRMLVAFDGSETSRKAVALAYRLAQENPGTSVIFAHAIKLRGAVLGDPTIDEVLFDRAERFERYLTAVAATLSNETSVKLLKGSSPADLIMGCATREGCDLIVMGSRGMGGVKGYLGSVSYAVVQEASMCVLIAKGDIPTTVIDGIDAEGAPLR